MWDVHWRIGGSAGTQLQGDACLKQPFVSHGANSTCFGAFLLLHITPTASVYMENNWGWVADHELDMNPYIGQQIDIYNGRGVLIESTLGVWLVGTAFEHSQLYNYQISNAENVYMGAIQSETA
jgi:glucan 1,3-beta-glucosidase